MVLLGLTLKAQVFHPQSNRYDAGSRLQQGFGTVGLAVGQETLMGVKFGHYIPLADIRRPVRRPNFGLGGTRIYAGVEGSMFGLFALWGSASLNAGINTGPLTVDCSVTELAVFGPDGQSFYETTYNPKVGVQAGPVWVKAGPSYVFDGESYIEDWMQWNTTSMNVELLFVIPN